MADFDSEKKQRLLIEYLISSTDTYALCQNIVNPAFFDPALRNSVSFIKDYYDKYDNTPSTDQIEAETDQQFVLRDVIPDKVKWTCVEIETFCRRKALEKAIYASPELIAKGDYGAVENNIREAILLSLNANLGLRYFDDPDARLQELLNSPLVESTGWTEIDLNLFGGLSRGELLLVAANSGGGKSITLANLGFNFLQRKKNVLYISLNCLNRLLLSAMTQCSRVFHAATGRGMYLRLPHVFRMLDLITVSLTLSKCLQVQMPETFELT